MSQGIESYVSNIVVSGGGGGGVSSINGDTTAAQQIKGGTNVTVTTSGGITTVNSTASGGSGNVTGPASSTDGQVALFNGTTGQLLKAQTVLPVSAGGTNSGTALNNNRVIISSGGAHVEQAALTASSALVSDTNGLPVASGVSATTLGFLDATSSVQTQLNSKQASGSYITALTGDVTASGPGSAAATLASVVTAGTNPKITYNAKGLVTGGAALASADIPNNASNTTGTAANVTGTVVTVNGGTGLTAPGTSGNVLTSNGTVWVSQAPTGGGGGFANPMTTSGDTIYGGTSGTATRLAGQTSATKNFLTQTGTGSASAAPGWGTIAAADVPTLNQNTTGTASNVTGVVAIANGGTGKTAVTVAPTATTIAGWDANANLSANNLIDGYATTATAGGTTTLTVASAFQQYFTGSANQTITLPVTSTMVLGQQFQIVNNSTGTLTVNSSGGNLVQSMAAGTTLNLAVVSTSLTTAAAWNFVYQALGLVPPALGGTGVANSSAATLTLTGAFAQTFTRSAASNVTLPTTGTLATLAGTETWTNKTLTSPAVNGQKVTWINPSGTTYTGLVTDDIIVTKPSLANSCAVSLPNSPGAGKMYKIVKTDTTIANVVTVTGTSFSRTLNTAFESMTVVYGADNVYTLIDAYVPSTFTSFTLAVNGSTTNPTYGTNTQSAYWRREGGALRIRWMFRQTAAGTAGSGFYFIPITQIDSSLTINTNVSPVDTTNGYFPGIGDARLLFNNTNFFSGHCFVYSSTAIACSFDTAGSQTSPQTWTASGTPFSTANYVMSIDALIPITGWNG